MILFFASIMPGSPWARDDAVRQGRVVGMIRGDSKGWAKSIDPDVIAPYPPRMKEKNLSD